MTGVQTCALPIVLEIVNRKYAAELEAAQAENRNRGVQFTTLIPGFVDTPPAVWAVQMGIAHEEMLAPEDLGEAVRFLLRTSPRCIIGQIELMPPDQPGFLARLAEVRRQRAAVTS